MTKYMCSESGVGNTERQGGVTVTSAFYTPRVRRYDKRPPLKLEAQGNLHDLFHVNVFRLVLLRRKEIRMITNEYDASKDTICSTLARTLPLDWFIFVRFPHFEKHPITQVCISKVCQL